MFTVTVLLTYNCVLQLLYNCVFTRYADSTDLKTKLTIRDHLGILLRHNAFFVLLSFISLCTRDNLGIILRRNAFFVLLIFISLSSSSTYFSLRRPLTGR